MTEQQPTKENTEVKQEKIDIPPELEGIDFSKPPVIPNGRGSAPIIRSDVEESFRKVILEASKIFKKYTVFFLFLTGMPKEQKQLALTFSEISKILDFALPKSAYLHLAWWSNTPSHPHAKAWMGAGWEVTEIYLPAETVVLYRIDDHRPVTNIPEYVKYILNHRQLKGVASSHILSNWIRFCRKVEWYFEGVVLFEKGGLDLNALDDTEQVEVEEDYHFCKKKSDEHKTSNPFY